MNLEALFDSGGIALVVLAVLAAEALIFRPLLIRFCQGQRYPGLLAGLIAGAGLTAALGAALARWPWQWIAFFMALSFLAHAIEVYLFIFPWSVNPLIIDLRKKADQQERNGL